MSETPLQIWPLPRNLHTGMMRFHIERMHRFYVGDLRDIRALRRDHALMHTARWANANTEPHAHLDVDSLMFVDMSTEGRSDAD